MMNRNRRRARSVALATLLLASITALLTAILVPRHAQAEVVASGPIVALGFSSKKDRDFVTPAVGWRFELAAGETLDRVAGKIGAALTFVVEPMAGVIVGDEDSAEVQVVPMARLQPSGERTRRFVPYLEGGIGLAYTGLDGIGLGSNILFSDNIGVGISMAGPDDDGEGWWSRWSIGYRLRHISHAGLWGESNSGLNTHYLTVTFD